APARRGPEADALRIAGKGLRNFPYPGPPVAPGQGGFAVGAEGHGPDQALMLKHVRGPGWACLYFTSLPWLGGRADVCDAKVDNVDQPSFIDRHDRRPAVDPIPSGNPPIRIGHQGEPKVVLATDLADTFRVLTVADRQDDRSLPAGSIVDALQAIQLC